MKTPIPSGRIGLALVLVIAALALAFGLWAGSRWLADPPPPSLQTAVLYPDPRPVAEFSLQRTDGSALTEANLRGHWTIAFFGFTHCPDICPTTLATFRQVWTELARRGVTDRVRFLFISVDPERDTPEKLASYVQFFSKDFVAATGTDEQLTRLTRSLGLLYVRDPDPAGGYNVDHSASSIIIDPDGRRAGLFRPPFVAEQISSDILTLVESR
ncbi:SCO family protein [Dokdonella sp.]|uniref:SCO family protein n=1 Tax=Dokdonella sp. TaxID=2291710 RepID=UPI003527CCD4